MPNPIDTGFAALAAEGQVPANSLQGACDNRWHREDNLSPDTQQPIQPSLAQRIAWAILIVLTLYLCYFSHLDVIGFVGPDEPRYAWIARDMAESGDWVTPRLYGKPWFEKPPLLYWGGAIFFKLLGEGHPEVAARLSSAISALLATLALAWLAWRTYGQECARWLLLLLPTSVGMIGFSHACATDMPFAGMLTIAMVCAAVVLGLVPPAQNTPILPRTPWLALLLFGFFLGLAVLAKGPAGIILIGGGVFFWALFTKRWRDALRLLHPAAIAAFCLTALPWYILCARRNPDFIRIFIIEHNFKRYLTPEFQHIQPFWFYIPVVLVAFLPWTAALLYGAATFLRRPFSQSHSPIVRLLLGFSVFPLLFFSISQSKLPGYILPAVPTLCFLICVLLTTRDRRVQKLLGRSFGAFALLCLVVAELIKRGRHSISSQVILQIFVVAISLVAVGSALMALALLYSGSTSRRSLTTSLAVCSVLFAIAFVDPRFFLFAFPQTSANNVVTHLRSHNIPFDQLQIDNASPRGSRYSLSFYLRREVPSWQENTAESVYVLSNKRSCFQIREIGFDCQGIDFGMDTSGWYLSRVGPVQLLSAPTSGRQPQ